MGRSHIAWGPFLHYAEQRLKESAAGSLSLPVVLQRMHSMPAGSSAENKLAGTDLQVCQLRHSFPGVKNST